MNLLADECSYRYCVLYQKYNAYLYFKYFVFFSSINLVCPVKDSGYSRLSCIELGSYRGGKKPPRNMLDVRELQGIPYLAHF